MGNYTFTRKDYDRWVKMESRGKAGTVMKARLRWWREQETALKERGLQISRMTWVTHMRGNQGAVAGVEPFKEEQS